MLLENYSVNSKHFKVLGVVLKTLKLNPLMLDEYYKTDSGEYWRKVTKTKDSE